MTTEVQVPETFRHVADQLPILLWRIDADLKEDWLNRAWVDFTGVPLAQQRGFFWLALVHPDDADHVSQILDAAFKGRKPVTATFRLRRHDGRYRWMTDTGVPVYRDGAFDGFAGFCIELAEELAAALIDRESSVG
jgi:PAS domain S-box-containing protein